MQIVGFPMRRLINVNITNKKLRKVWLSACNTRPFIFHEMRTPYYYEVSFYFSNEVLSEMMTGTEALKFNVKVDWSPLNVSQNCHIVRFVYQL